MEFRSQNEAAAELCFWKGVSDKVGFVASLSTSVSSGDISVSQRSRFVTAFTPLLRGTFHHWATADISFIIQILDSKLGDCSEIFFLALQAVLFLCSRFRYYAVIFLQMHGKC